MGVSRRSWDIEATGSMMLAIVFFLSSAVYYFANWKALADVWPVR